MSLEPRHIRELTAEIAAPTAKARELAAEKVASWLTGSLDPKLAAALARALEVAISLEDDETALQSQLNAVCEFSELGLAPRDVIERVVGGRDWSYTWATDYIDQLRDDLPVAPQ
jgi:hypothetical protein